MIMIIIMISMLFIIVQILLIRNNKVKKQNHERYIENEKIIEKLKAKLTYKLTIINDHSFNSKPFTIERQEEIISIYKNNLLKLKKDANIEKNRLFTDDEINGYIDYYDVAMRVIRAEGKYKIYFTEKQEKNLNRELINETVKAIQHPEINYYNNMFSKNKIYRFVQNYVVFDIETTGLNCIKDKIIEIGALKYHKGKLVDTFHYLVNPKIEISNEISNLTGITNDMLKIEKTIEEILPKFVEFIDDYVLIAHNSSFDLSFIERNLKLLDMNLIENKNIDTLYLSKKYITFTKNYKLETLKQALNLKYKSHNALDDCCATNDIYNYCKSLKQIEHKKN